jgi:membrane fusion protein, multidrug efflux system
MKKKIIISVILSFILLLIVTILLLNKQKSQKNLKQDLQTEIPVNVEKVSKEKIKEELSLVGTIMGYNDVMIISETQGRVIKVYAEVGDYKTAGSPLIKVEDELMLANFITAEANYTKAKKDYERFKALAGESSITESQLESALLGYKAAEAKYIVARKQFNDTKITTPISGIVVARYVDFGTMVGPSAPVANVVDISKLKIRLNISEKDILKIKLKDKVAIVVDLYPDHKYEGIINSISDKSDQAHTYQVEITLNNDKKYPLKAGMFGRVYFDSISESESLVIPREAFVGSARRPQVFVVKDNFADLREIVIGIEVGTKVQVLKGLDEGDIIVVNGQNNLKDKSQVLIIK